MRQRNIRTPYTINIFFPEIYCQIKSLPTNCMEISYDITFQSMTTIVLVNVDMTRVICKDVTAYIKTRVTPSHFSHIENIPDDFGFSYSIHPFYASFIYSCVFWLIFPPKRHYFILIMSLDITRFLHCFLKFSLISGLGKIF